MARLGAQRVVNNFAGGLVTEASPLAFPENSLSKAMNIEIMADGSCKSRPMFSQFEWSRPIGTGVPGPYPIKTNSVLRKFEWRERNGVVLVIVSDDTMTFVIHKEEGTTSLQLSIPLSHTLSEDAGKYIDLSFTEDSIYFVAPLKNQGNRNTLYKIDCPIGSQLCTICPPYAGKIVVDPEPVREPPLGSTYVRNLSTRTAFRASPLGEEEIDERIYEFWWEGTKVFSTSIYDGNPGDVTEAVVGEWTYYKTNFIVSDGQGQWAGVYRVGMSSGSVSAGDRQPVTGDLFEAPGLSIHNRSLTHGVEYHLDEAAVNTVATFWWDGVVVWQDYNTSGANLAPSLVSVGNWTYYRGDYRMELPQAYPEWMYYYGIYRVAISDSGGGTSSVNSAQPLSYRDFRGVSDPDPETGVGVNKPPSHRPVELSAHHAYNLYNSGWPLETTYKYLSSEGATTTTSGKAYPLATREVAGFYPGLNESHYEYLTTTGGAAVLGYYSPATLAGQPSEFSRAKRGSHILTLGYEHLGKIYKPGFGSYFLPNSFKTGTLPEFEDEFFAEAKAYADQNHVVTAMAIIGGRAWYGITGRHFKLAYSQIDLKNDFDASAVGRLSKCYQENDPNSEDVNQVLDTDGGTISAEEIGTVYNISSFRNYILIFADNGVWAISGDESLGFRPTSYTLIRLAHEGIRTGAAVAVGDDGVYYLTDNDLRMVGVNDSGSIMTSNLSQERVLSLMTEVSRGFSDSLVPHMFVDESSKRLFINYNKRPPKSPGADDRYDILGANVSLVYDLRLGCFYQWEQSDNRVGVNSNNTISLEEANGVPLIDPDQIFFCSVGLYTSKKGVRALSLDFPLVAHSSSNANFTLALDSPEQDIGIWSHSPIDGVEANQDIKERLVPKPVIEFEIPFDTVGDISLSKSVQTITVFQSAEEKYFDTSTNIFRRPRLEMSAFWDWNNEGMETVDLMGTIKYPDHVHYKDKKVLINKMKIPGSGRCLSLNFKNSSFQDVGGFKLLAYHLDVNADNRP